MTDEMILRWLKEDDPEKLKTLYREAYQTKLNNVGNSVYFRGIVEFSNICAKNCNYCGIRAGNVNVHRYQLTREEMVECAIWADREQYGSIVLQSGERYTDDYVDFVDEVIREIKRKTDGRLGMTLSLGEQSDETYRRWFESGAHRYLIRIETSSPELYSQIHPNDERHRYENRLRAIRSLRDIGYQAGTGVMIGLPGQTDEHLLNDIRFFEEMNIDMIGMGPYIRHADTPMSSIPEDDELRKRRFEKALKMIALTRLTLPDINIAATTALQALHPWGRERGLRAGANVIMPNITPRKYRADYQLYADKPCIDEDTDACLTCLEKRIQGVGDVIGYGKWGDSPHYHKRMEK